MSFIFKVERPQHIKYGYGYYIRFEDDSFYIGATSKFDNGEYNFIYCRIVIVRFFHSFEKYIPTCL